MLNVQNIARVNFKRWSFNVLQDKLNLTNMKNNLINKLLLCTAFGLQKTNGSL